MALLETFTSGPYTGTYNSIALGLSREGYTIAHEMKQQVIESSDAYGDTLMDYIYRGVNLTVSFTMLSYTKAISAGLLAPFTGSAGGGAAAGRQNTYYAMVAASPVGALASSLAQSLVLTAVSGTPAATNGPASITFPGAILAPGSNWEELLDSRLREIPVKLQILPYNSTGTITFGTTT